MNATEIAAWLAVIGTAATLLGNGAKIIVRRRKERDKVTEALDQAPYVREQLWLGNVGGAVEHLTSIVQSQGVYIRDLEERHNREIEELEARHMRRVVQLEEEVGIERGKRTALEHEVRRLTKLLNGGNDGQVLD